jgi:hypothetical protein
MSMRNRLMAIGAATLVAAWCAMGGLAAASFPNFSDCPIAEAPSGSACIDIQSVRGEFVIKGFHVPLDHSLEIRGALSEGEGTFIPPRGTNGFFATPVNVPGGLLGFELPFGFERVTATAELAGTPSQIRINTFENSISMPLKVRLSNPLIGSNCHIGTNSHPVLVHIITGTTNPPPPNRPITGRIGRGEFIPPATIVIRENINVDNSFSIPGATECGGFGLLDLAVDAKLQIPSAAGNNSIEINNDIGLMLP